MNKTKWIIFALLVVAVFGGIIYMSKTNDKSSFTGDASKIITDGPIADQVYGSRDQKVVLIEYGDYQCPACLSMYTPVKAMTEQYKDKVTFIFRNFPLTNIHPNALAASTAAEAASLQGKFWEMHDKLYETQDDWKSVAVDKREAVFAGYASEVGMDAEKFKADLKSADVAAKIARDRAAGNKAGVASTPTFFLNGEKIDGTNAVDAQVLQEMLLDKIKAAYPEAVLPAPSPTAPPVQQ
ncbi:MAG TPA: thioredoxin domain-containing protein [Candidatus Saccharimonadales bacterium]|nr:thioredoxin domain-containing protein [Candidatus Saccharimonadales bacterium]